MRTPPIPAHGHPVEGGAHPHGGKLAVCAASRAATGLTLVEVLLAIGLLSILAGTTIGLLYWQARTGLGLAERADGMARLADAHLAITKEVRGWARSTLSPSAEWQLALASGSPPINHYRFSPESGALLVIDAAGAEVPLVDGLASASFRYDGDHQVLRVAMETAGRFPVSLRFLVFPRRK